MELEDFLLNLIHLKFQTVCFFVRQDSKLAAIEGIFGQNTWWIKYNEIVMTVWYILHFFNPVCYLIWFDLFCFICIVEEKKWTKIILIDRIEYHIFHFVEYLAFPLVSLALFKNLSLALIGFWFFTSNINDNKGERIFTPKKNTNRGTF